MEISRRRFIAAVSTLPTVPAMSQAVENSGQTHEGDFELVGHRGVSGLEEDNSMDGFERAVEIGVDGIEVDIRMTEDDRLVLYHDPVVFTTDNMPMVIGSNTYENLQQNVDIVLLEEFLSFVEDKSVKAYLGFKQSEAIDKAVEMATNYLPKERIVLISISESSARKFPDNITTALAGAFPSDILISNANDAGVDLILPHFIPEVIYSEEDMRSFDGFWLLHEREPDVERVLELRPSILISNRPDLVLELSQ